jgi:pilus assembly protein Flp/PilA
MKWLAKFIKEDSGATAVEYGIMVAAIAAVIILVVIAIGTKVNSAFEKVNSAMTPLSGS